MNPIAPYYYPPTPQPVHFETVYLNGFKIPTGYEPTGEFRMVARGEEFLDSNGYSVALSLVYGDYGPRIVLKPVKRKRVMFTETGEFRQPQEGEWFRYGQKGNYRDNYVLQSLCSNGRFAYAASYPIVIREETEV